MTEKVLVALLKGLCTMQATTFLGTVKQSLSKAVERIGN